MFVSVVEAGRTHHTKSDDAIEQRNKVGVFAGVRVGIILIQSLRDDSKFVFVDDITQTKYIIEGSKDGLDHCVVRRQLAGSIG